MGGSKPDEYNEISLDIVSDSRDVQTVVISLHPKSCSCLYKGKNICCQDYRMPRIRCFTACREFFVFVTGCFQVLSLGVVIGAPPAQQKLEGGSELSHRCIWKHISIFQLTLSVFMHKIS